MPFSGRAALRLALLFLPPLLFSVAPTLAQDSFRWVDEQGVFHFTDDPYRIPVQFRAASLREAGGDVRSPVDEPQDTSAGLEEGKYPGMIAPRKQMVEGDDDAPPEKGGSPYEEVQPTTTDQFDNQGNDKSFWQSQRQYWENRLKMSRQRYAEARRKFNLTNQRFDKKQYKELKTLRALMRQLEIDIAQAEAMLENGLAREARKAGAPPGWVR